MHPALLDSTNGGYSSVASTSPDLDEQHSGQCGEDQMVFQEPYLRPNPRWRVSDLISEAFRPARSK